MQTNANKWLTQPSRRKGGLEINSLVIWIILIVFLVLIVVILIATKGEGSNAIDSLCAKSGGILGCG